MKNLGPWGRVGLVLSVIWAFCGFIYEWMAEMGTANIFYSSVYGLCLDKVDHANCAAEALVARKPFTDPILVDSLIVALAPIPIVWLFVWLVRRTIQWILAGRKI
jgi:hypothetical protein